MKAIMAMSENRAIGKEGKIPWISKDDFKWFKEFTLNKTLLVGFNTYKDLPNLKSRKLLVLDKSRINESFYNPVIDKVVYYTSEETALSLDKIYNGELIVIGGSKTYDKFMPYITEFYVSHIKGTYDADTFMSPFEHLFPKQETIRTLDIGVVIRYSR